MGNYANVGDNPSAETILGLIDEARKCCNGMTAAQRDAFSALQFKFDEFNANYVKAMTQINERLGRLESHT